MENVPAFVQTLTQALTNQLANNGLTAEVSSEPVVGTKMHRFYVVSDGFAEMMHSERQSVVWRIADQALDPSDALKISMILTLTHDEIDDSKSAAKVG
jgi:hypothetical protein